tara:strand:+ start:84 stop:503 length:420 start_codon:yes stop_codon:yes gene_type:complete
MKKVVRLTENDLTRIVKRVLKEQKNEKPVTKKVSTLDFDFGGNNYGVDIYSQKGTSKVEPFDKYKKAYFMVNNDKNTVVFIYGNGKPQSPIINSPQKYAQLLGIKGNNILEYNEMIAKIEKELTKALDGINVTLPKFRN